MSLTLERLCGTRSDIDLLRGMDQFRHDTWPPPYFRQATLTDLGKYTGHILTALIVTDMIAFRESSLSTVFDACRRNTVSEINPR